MIIDNKVATLPKIQFVLNQHTEQEYHHNRLELLFVLSGNLEVNVNQKVYSLKKEDLILINNYEVHIIHNQKDANFLSLWVDTSFIQEVFPKFSELVIDFNSLEIPHNKLDQLYAVQKSFARIFSIAYKVEVDCELELYGEVLNLFKILVISFSRTQSQELNGLTSERIGHIKNIIRYVQKHYTENITLKDLSEHEYLTPQYISRLFQKQMNMTLTQYITLVRLNHAYSELMNMNHSITEIGYNNGFKNVNAFITSFKKKYNMTPGHYKKVKKTQHENDRFNLQSHGEIKDLHGNNKEAHDIFAVLQRYGIDKEGINDTKKGYAQSKIVIENPYAGTKLVHSWKNLINVGYAKDILNGSVKSQIIDIQQKIKFNYIRFHGLMDDDMYLYHEDANGNAILNYVYVDQVIDFILSIDLLPFIEFGFMPTQLAKVQNTLFLRKSIFSMPKSLKKWAWLIRTLTDHFLHRYGLESLKEWKFTLFNQIPIEKNHPMDDLTYAHLYKSTFQSVKSVFQDLSFGANYRIFSHSEEVLEGMQFSFYREHNVMPDFLTFQSYMIKNIKDEIDEGEEICLIKNDDAFSYVVSGDKDLLNTEIDCMHEIIKLYDLDYTDIYLTEWNSNIWQRDLCNDTCYKAAFIAKNIIDNYDRIGGFGYWSLSDNMEETWPSQYIFHGGFGLFTTNGIPKSGYYAMEFLNGLGSQLVQRGKGYMVTKEKEEIQILLYNYCHFDQPYRYRHVAHMDHWNRYSVFENNNELQFELRIQNLIEGQYQIRKYAINRESGSAYDLWLKMGAPDRLQVEELSYVIRHSTPDYHISYEMCDGNYELKSVLAPHEVQLFKIIKI